MERDERNIYIRLGIIIAVWLIAEIILLTRNANAAEGAKNAPYSASESSDEDFIAEESEAAKTGQISQMTAIDDNSAMPCCDPEGFGEWYESYCASSREDEETESETDIPTEVGEIESGTDEVPVTHLKGGTKRMNRRQAKKRRSRHKTLERYTKYLTRKPRRDKRLMLRVIKFLQSTAKR